MSRKAEERRAEDRAEYDPPLEGGESPEQREAKEVATHMGDVDLERARGEDPNSPDPNAPERHRVDPDTDPARIAAEEELVHANETWGDVPADEVREEAEVRGIDTEGKSADDLRVEIVEIDEPEYLETDDAK